jgi:hypothetical protein
MLIIAFSVLLLLGLITPQIHVAAAEGRLRRNSALNKCSDIPYLLQEKGLTVGAELGVQWGRRSDYFLSIWSSCNTFYLVDVWKQQENYQDPANVPDDQQAQNKAVAQQMMSKFGSKVVFMHNSTLNASFLIPDQSLDFVFVDARHDYCGTYEDIAAYWPKLKPGGIMAGHDYHSADEISGQDWSLCQNGTRNPSAVNDFAAQNGISVHITLEKEWKCWIYAPKGIGIESAPRNPFPFRKNLGATAVTPKKAQTKTQTQTQASSSQSNILPRKYTKRAPQSMSISTSMSMMQVQHSQDATHKGAIVMMVTNWRVRRNNRKCHFNMSMDALRDYWRPHNKYPVILLDTKPWERKDMFVIRSMWPTLDIHFENVANVFNAYPLRTESSNPTISTLEYKRMCAFFTFGFLEVPLLKRYRYHMRMDDDTCLCNSINYDMFDEMASFGTSYGFHGMFNDWKEFTQGLYEFSDGFISNNSLSYANPSLHEFRQRTGRILAFSTNLEIIDTVRYRQQDISAFVTEIKHSDMIFGKRWGDANIRYLIAEMFWGPREVLQFCDFDYQHSSWFPYHMCSHRDNDNAVLQYAQATTGHFTINFPKDPQDSNSHCKEWALQKTPSECVLNPTYMFSVCPKSCHEYSGACYTNSYKHQH